MREEALAAEFGRSRHTIRRALEQLVAERLLISDPYAGMKVTQLFHGAVVELQRLRGAFVGEAIGAPQ